MKKTLLVLLAALVSVSCSKPQATQDEAAKFLADAEEKLQALGVEAQHADWIHENFITDDSEAVSAKADQRAIDASVVLSKGTTQFDSLQLPADMARKMKLLKVGLVLATPSDP